MIEYIEKDTARRIINSPRTKEQMLSMLEGSFTMALPKHYGRLIDADTIDLDNIDWYDPYCYIDVQKAIDDAPTVLAATKEEVT